MERLAGLEPACIALEERCLNPLGHRRAITAKSWYRGRGSNSTSPLCRRGALNQKATPALWLWGQDSNLRINWLTARRPATWLPHNNWSGTSDLNRDSLGPRPSGLIRFPSPRMSKIWSERLESNQRPRASETRALIQLSYAHTHWNRRPESNRHFFVRTEVSSPLDDTRTIGVTGGD